MRLELCSGLTVLRMNRCWAACLDGCSDKISGEHIVTRGTFTDDSVRVKGLPWCATEFKTIGLSSFVKKALCREHNSRLSEVDNAAIEFRKTLCEIVDLSSERGKLPPQQWSLETFTANGLALERWCLKTLITIAIDGGNSIGDGDTGPGTVPRELVEIAFDLRRFQPPHAGLYWMGNAGTDISVAEGVEIATFSNVTKRISGARISYWGFGILLMLTNTLSPGEFVFHTGDGKALKPQVTRRPHKLGIGVSGRNSHVLEFNWPPGTA